MMLQIFAFVNTLILLPTMIFQIIFGAIVYCLGTLLKNKKLRVHGKDLALAADQNMNVIWLGHPDETISSRIGRSIESGKPKWYIKYLLRPFVDWAARRFGDGPNHCKNSIEWDEKMDEQYEIWKWYKN